MSLENRIIEPVDILPLEQYRQTRAQHRAQLLPVKRRRRVAVGPYCHFYFESYATMWYQIHEMLLIEGGGNEQLVDELAAYNPLIPQGSELVATFMIEIADEAQRRATLAKLGGIESSLFLYIGDQKIAAQAEEDIDRTTSEGKASAVHFVHFAMSDAQKRAFAEPKTALRIAVEHPEYQHMAGISEQTRVELLTDLDL